MTIREIFEHIATMGSYCDKFPDSNNDIDKEITQSFSDLYKALSGLRPNKEKILVSMMNQIPKKYHDNPDIISEFTDIIEDTLNEALADMDSALKKALGVKG